MAPVVKPNSFQPNILDSVLVVNLAEEIPARGSRRCRFLSSTAFNRLLQGSPNCKRILLIHIFPPLPFPHHTHFKNKGLAQSTGCRLFPGRTRDAAAPRPRRATSLTPAAPQLLLLLSSSPRAGTGPELQSAPLQLARDARGTLAALPPRAEHPVNSPCRGERAPKPGVPRAQGYFHAPGPLVYMGLKTKQDATHPAKVSICA